MEKYIVNNNTVALLKIDKKTIIFNVDNFFVFNRNIKYILDKNCNYYGSNLIGRINSSKEMLNESYKIPILIDEVNNLILIQLTSPRNKVCLYIVVNKIINYKEINDFLEIICVNGIIFKVKLSKNIFEKMLLKSFKLNNVLFWRKCVKFL